MVLPQADLQVQDYRILVEQSPLLISQHSKNGAFTYASPTYKELLGYEPTELNQQMVINLVHPDEQSQIQPVVSGLWRENIHKTNGRWRTQNGRFVWLETIWKRSPDGQSILAFSRENTLKNVDEALRILSHGPVDAHGLDYFRILVSQVSAALHRPFAFITEHFENKTKVRMLAFWQGNDFGVPFEYGLAGTPCDFVINQGKTSHYPMAVQAIFPNDQDLVTLSAQGYIGVPLYNADKKIIGHLALLDNKPLVMEDYEWSLLRIFAARAGTELEMMQTTAGNN